MSDVAVVVLNFNGRHLLDDCLGRLSQLQTPVRVVLADNGSIDGSLAYVREHFPAVQTLDLGRNLGFAAGYNQALAEVDYPWLVLANNDAVLEPDWVERLLAWAADRPRAAILGGKLLFSTSRREPAIIQSAGASFTVAGTAFEIGWGEVDRGQYDQPRLVGAIPGAALLVRRQVFFELGGFDADYGIYLEDVDLCWRAWLRGYEVHYVPTAVARHQYGASTGGRSSPYRIRLMQRNRLVNMFKNLEASSLPTGLAVSLAYDAYRVLEYGRRRQAKALQALAAGSLAFWQSVPITLARRAKVQRTRVVDDGSLRQRDLLISAVAAFHEYRRLDKTPKPAPAAPA
jgi:GT2 family glycosyltransferase